MPFKSEAQRRFMYAKHPKMAKEWEKKTKGKLPEKSEGVVEGTIGDYIRKMTKAPKHLRKGWNMHRNIPAQQHPAVEYGLFDPGAPDRPNKYASGIKRGWKLRRDYKKRTIAGLGLAGIAGIAGLAALTYGAKKAFKARKDYLRKNYTAAALKNARWRKKIAMSTGATSGALMGLAGGAAKLLSPGMGMSKMDMAKLLATTGTLGALAGGTISTAFTPGPQKRRGRRMREAVETLKNGDSVEDVVEYLLNEE